MLGFMVSGVWFIASGLEEVERGDRWWVGGEAGRWWVGLEELAWKKKPSGGGCHVEEGQLRELGRGG
jgi:hypothetical protein